MVARRDAKRAIVLSDLDERVGMDRPWGLDLALGRGDPGCRRAIHCGRTELTYPRGLTRLPRVLAGAR